MQNIEAKRIMTLSLKLFLIFAHTFAAIVAFLGLAVLLIGVYHTSIFLVAHAWSPIFLYVLPTVTLGLSLGVIFLKQPVHNLLCLISVFFSAALLYLYVGAEFLAFLFLIVYVGAIAILFLFVIMLLHLKPVFAVTLLVISGFAWFSYPSAGLVALGLDDTLANGISNFFVESDTLAAKNAVTSADSLTWFVNNKFSDILLFSDLLYTYHCFLFFVAGLLLLTAMLGAIILATSATDANPTVRAQLLLIPLLLSCVLEF